LVVTWNGRGHRVGLGHRLSEALSVPSGIGTVPICRSQSDIEALLGGVEAFQKNLCQGRTSAANHDLTFLHSYLFVDLASWKFCGYAQVAHSCDSPHVITRTPIPRKATTGLILVDNPRLHCQGWRQGVLQEMSNSYRFIRPFPTSQGYPTCLKRRSEFFQKRANHLTRDLRVSSTWFFESH
jgi:hypothetical protein